MIEPEELLAEGTNSREGSSEQDGEGAEYLAQAYFLSRSYEDESEQGEHPSEEVSRARGERKDAQGQGTLRADNVHVGQLVCVVDVSGRGGELEHVKGRCGEVRSVDPEAKAVLLEFSDPLDAHAVSTCTVHLSAVGRPERVIAQTLGYALSLRGSEMWRAFGQIQFDMAIRAARRAACCMILNSGEGSVEVSTVDGMEKSLGAGPGGQRKGMVRKLCRVAALHLSEEEEARRLFKSAGEWMVKSLHCSKFGVGRFASDWGGGARRFSSLKMSSFARLFNIIATSSYELQLSSISAFAEHLSLCCHLGSYVSKFL